MLILSVEPLQSITSLTRGVAVLFSHATACPGAIG
jgi:hypothetical protein